MKYCELREFRCKIMSLNEIPQNHTLYSKAWLKVKLFNLHIIYVDNLISILYKHYKLTA